MTPVYSSKLVDVLMLSEHQHVEAKEKVLRASHEIFHELSSLEGSTREWAQTRVADLTGFTFHVLTQNHNPSLHEKTLIVKRLVQSEHDESENKVPTVVKEKILAAQRDAKQVLSLAMLKMHSLPFCVGRLSVLTHLNCSLNQLKDLPDSISLLENLHHLNCGNNKFSHLPRSLLELKRLNFLSFASNALTTLPVWVNDFENLETLDISSNPISGIPDEISPFVKKGRFLFHAVRPRSISEAIRAILIRQNLEQWAVSVPKKLDNSIKRSERKYLHETLWKQYWDKEATHLDLESFELTTLPDCLQYYTHLRIISLSSNRFSTVPPVVCKLTNLESLCLMLNRVETFPESIRNLTSLKKLSLAYNDLKDYPEILSSLPNLAELDLSGNNSIVSRDVAPPPNLRELIFSKGVRPPFQFSLKVGLEIRHQSY